MYILRVLVLYFTARLFRSGRVQVLGAVGLTTMLLNGIAAKDYVTQQRYAAQRVSLAAKRENTIERVFVARPSATFAYVDRSDLAHTPPYLIVTPWAVDTPTETLGTDDNAYFASLDWRSLYEFIFLPLAFLVSYDAIAAERETGRWRIILAHPIRPCILVGAASLAGATVGCFVLAVSMMINLVPITLSKVVPLSKDLLLRYGGSFVLMAGGIIIAVILGCLVSCLVSTCWEALLGVLLLWLALTVLVPVFASICTQILAPTPPLDRLRNEIHHAQISFYERAGPISSFAIANILSEHLPRSAEQDRINKLNEDEARRSLHELQRFKAEVTELRTEFLGNMEMQNRLREKLSRASPFEVVRQGVDATFVAGGAFEENFASAVNRYVNVFSPVSEELQKEWFHRALRSGPRIEEDGYTLSQPLWVDYSVLPHRALAKVPLFVFRVPRPDWEQFRTSLSILVIQVLITLIFLGGAATIRWGSYYR